MVNPKKKFPWEYGHGRANYINGPRVAVARSLPANTDQVISNSSATASAVRAPGPGLKLQAPSSESSKRQASSPKQQASSSKPQASSSLILDPRYMDIEEVLGVQGPRVFAKINVLCG